MDNNKQLFLNFLYEVDTIYLFVICFTLLLVRHLPNPRMFHRLY